MTTLHFDSRGIDVGDDDAFLDRIEDDRVVEAIRDNLEDSECKRNCLDFNVDAL